VVRTRIVGAVFSLRSTTNGGQRQKRDQDSGSKPHARIPRREDLSS
jgi:hypothetical protein